MNLIKNSMIRCRYLVQPGRVHIDSLIVYEEFRNNGVGTLFMKQLMQEHRGKRFTLQILSNKPLSFYKRLGFKVTDIRVFDYHGNIQEATLTHENKENWIKHFTNSPQNVIIEYVGSFLLNKTLKLINRKEEK